MNEKKNGPQKKDSKWSQVTFKLKQIQYDKIKVYFQKCFRECLRMYIGGTLSGTKVEENSFFFLFRFADSFRKCKKSWLNEKKREEEHECQDGFFSLGLHHFVDVWMHNAQSMNAIRWSNKIDTKTEDTIKSFDLGIRFNWQTRIIIW